ncbi:nicotinate (nicotinamide) nucleotide adenylyltransferase [Brevibacillus sp. NPDC058079]|uniref:nicotinate (nicotinamide) nucleotide adenylyltransferase n=1 Tax=Brevibacillus sp. NPDC058079 TaxID=3346330 RepID=UPI0036E55918
MRKIGFFGASFDPITNSHLWTASKMAERCGLQKIIMGPCSTKRPDKTMKISDEHRWNLLQLAIADNPLFIADDYEMQKEASKVFTYFTMEYYKQMHPNDEVYFMMGADLLVSIAKGEWQYGQELVENNKFIVMSRDGIDMQKTLADSKFLKPYVERFQLLEKGMEMEISSSYIRNELISNEDPKYLQYLMPRECYKYIMQHGLYR